MADKQESKNPGRGWQQALVGLASMMSVAAVAFGVARKESCSSAIGSVESYGSLYGPCDLVGLQVVIALVALVGITVVGSIEDRRTRLVGAVIAVISVAMVLFIGYASLALP